MESLEKPMQITRLRLKNWRNFRSVDVPLGSRTTLIGANASGKSNFLEVFRFLRTVAQKEGGGLQQAVKERHGLGKLRSLHARRDPELSIEVELLDETTDPPTHWSYLLALRGKSNSVQVSKERIKRNGKVKLDRPNEHDHADPERLTETTLEQINSNREFRSVADFFAATTYLHLVPQLLKHGEAQVQATSGSDPFGQGLLQRIAATNKRVRDTRIKRIQKALAIAVPLFSELRFEQDPVTGRWHLEANFNHWRGNAAWQREDQFSDGTLRLIGLLWALQDGDGLILLEEPELSLNEGIVRCIPLLIDRVLRANQRTAPGRPVLISTHSASLLSELHEPQQLLLIEPGPNGSSIREASPEEVEAMQHGLNAAEVLLPKTRPDGLDGLGLFA
jgi:predicted ATPase